MMKSGNLLHKCGLGDSDMNSTVPSKLTLIKAYLGKFETKRKVAQLQFEHIRYVPTKRTMTH